MKANARDHLSFLVKKIELLSSSVQPFWHPLGFVSCVIKDRVDGVTLRVHIWPLGERRTKNPDWPIHTHSYTLSSLVLNGHIEDIQYQISSGEQYTVYEVAYAHMNSEIKKTTQGVQISDANVTKRSVGDQYDVEKGIFHQSRVELESTAITLVALSDFSETPPLVLGKSGDVRYPYDRIPFDREIFWLTVREALESYNH